MIRSLTAFSYIRLFLRLGGETMTPFEKAMLAEMKSITKELHQLNRNVARLTATEDKTPQEAPQGVLNGITIKQ